VFEGGKISSGSAWIVPVQLHRPLKQDALLLKPGQSNPAATALLAFLATEPAQKVMRSFGYTH
jgi:molybdate transport system substrate-binding protein